MYLRVLYSLEVGYDVKLDALCRPRKGDTPDEEDGQYHVREEGREVHHLVGNKGIML